jgi:hypothetical protein
MTRLIQSPTLHQIVSVFNLVRHAKQIAASGVLEESTEGKLRDLIATAEIQFLLPPVVNDNRTEPDLDGEIAAVCGQLNSIETVGI